MIAEGIVGDITKTGKGTPKVKIGSDWYYPGRGVQIDGMTSGTKIGIEYNLFGDKNNLRSIVSWALLPNQAIAALSQGLPPIAAPTPSNAVSGPIMDAERPCISNWGAELIKAGIIKDPVDLGIWVNAAKLALRQ